MAVFKVHSIETAPEGSRARLASVRKVWGFVPNLHAILAESPVALEAYDTLFGLVGKATLKSEEQQLVYLTVSVFHGCEYCTMGHTYLARSAGLAEAAIQQVRDAKPLSDVRLDALRRFTEAVLEERGFVGEPAIDAFLAAGYRRANVLEIVTIIATKTISNYVNHFAHTPLESFMSDPALSWAAPARRATAA